MMSRKSQRIVRRTLTEQDRWLDLEVALKDDCVEALQTKMEFHGIDVHMTYGFDVPPRYPHASEKVTASALSLAVTHGAVKCVAYLKEMDARSHDLLSGSGYSFTTTRCIGYNALEEEMRELMEEEAKERWANFASTKFGLAKSVAKEMYHDCCDVLAWTDDDTGDDVTVVSAYYDTIIDGEDISDWHERLDSHDYCMATWDMYEKAEYNTLQLATFKYGRDSLITRLVRDERKEIAKSYKLGFAALRYYADSQRASLLLAKNDGRLWLILKGLTAVGIPVELREKIVDFAFFGKDAPERQKPKKAKKVVTGFEDFMESEDEDFMESESEDDDE